MYCRVDVDREFKTGYDCSELKYSSFRLFVECNKLFIWMSVQSSLTNVMLHF